MPDPLIPYEDIAATVAKNTAAWVITENRPVRGQGSKSIGIQRIVGNVVIDEFKMELTRGQSYPYKTDKLQGLTPVSATPLLFGTMAPDQYLLPNPVHLDENTVQKLNSILKSIYKAKGKEDSDFSAQLKALDVQDANPAIQHILEEILIIKCSAEESQQVAVAVQEFFGSLHIEKIAELNGAGEEKQYAALTIIGNKRSEAAGFGLKDPNKNLMENLKSSTTINGAPSVAVYKGHHSHIAQQCLVQSTAQLPDQSEVGKLAITEEDLDILVKFYSNTMAKEIPVAVNCTDGIDRTGMMMTAMMMLHEFAKGNDITKKTPDEQKKHLMDLTEGLRRDRGPFFLRGTQDIAVGITLGYALIAAKKQMDFGESATIEQIAEKKRAYEAFSKMNFASNNIRTEFEQARPYADEDSEDYLQQRVNIKDFIKDFIQNPTLNDFQTLAKITFSKNEILEEFKNYSINPKIIELAIAISQNKKDGAAQAKAFFSTIGTEEKKEFKFILRILNENSKTSDKEMTKIFNTLSLSLPSDKRARSNDKKKSKEANHAPSNAGTKIDLSNRNDLAAIYQYSKDRYASENFDFLFATHRLRQALEKSRGMINSTVLDQIKEIENQFIKDDSPQQINIDGKTKQKPNPLERILAAESEIQDLIKKDILHPFSVGNYKKSDASKLPPDVPTLTFSPIDQNVVKKFDPLPIVDALLREQSDQNYNAVIEHMLLGSHERNHVSHTIPNTDEGNKIFAELLKRYSTTVAERFIENPSQYREQMTRLLSQKSSEINSIIRETVKKSTEHLDSKAIDKAAKEISTPEAANQFKQLTKKPSTSRVSPISHLKAFITGKKDSKLPTISPNNPENPSKPRKK